MIYEDRNLEIIRPEAVNVKTKGYPWLAGLVTNVNGETVQVFFPGAQNPGPFDYTQDQVRLFSTQFPEVSEKLQPKSLGKWLYW